MLGEQNMSLLRAKGGGRLLTPLHFILSVAGKFGALFASIPFTIFAAVYCVLFGLVGWSSCFLPDDVLWCNAMQCCLG